jgi:hypothetical protein
VCTHVYTFKAVELELEYTGNKAFNG